MPTTPPQPHELTVGVLEMIMKLAPVFHLSRMFKVASPEQAMVIMIKGYELGFLPTAAFDLIDVIEGKATLKPQGAMALIHRSGNFEITITDEKDLCRVWMRRRDTGFEHTATFGLRDAQLAGIVKDKGAYTTYARDMYQWRAIARCARLVAPDVMAGMYLSAEFQSIEVQPDTDEVQA